jgi:hypothetical protein
VWSSPKATAHRRRLPDVARRTRQGDSILTTRRGKPDPLRSHSCRPCRVGPSAPLRRCVEGCSGLLIMARSRRGCCAAMPGRSPAPQRERVEGVALEARERKEQWLVRKQASAGHVRGPGTSLGGVQVQARAGQGRPEVLVLSLSMIFDRLYKLILRDRHFFCHLHI